MSDHEPALEPQRDAIVRKMLVIAHELLDSLDQPYLVYRFGGRDNEFADHELDRPPAEVQLVAMRSASIAFDAATRLLDREPGGSLDQANSMLGRLALRFGLVSEGEDAGSVDAD